jgi:hypothetical protein
MQINLARTGLAVAGLGLGAVMLAACAQADATPAAPDAPAARYERPLPHLVKRIEPAAPATPSQVKRTSTSVGDPAPPFVAARP